jgi:uncharacterized protein
MTEDQPHAEIIRHMEQHHGPVQEFCLTEILPVTGINVHIIPAGPGRDFVTLFTAGVSDRPMNVPEGFEEYRFAEIIIRLPAGWPTSPEALDSEDTAWPYQWLRMIGAYPSAEDSWLRDKYAIFPNGDPPEPFASNTRLSCLMLLQDISPAGRLQCEDGRTIIFYQVLPLYTEERDLELEQGILELLTRFDAAEVSEVVDLRRPNVAAATT